MLRSRISVQRPEKLPCAWAGDGQTTENLHRELEEVAVRSGWTIVGAYEDAGVSGADGRDKRPAFDRLCKDAARRKLMS